MRSKKNLVKPGRILAAAASAALLFLSSCSAPAMLRPASETSQAISNLTWAIFGLAALVFVVVEALLIFATIRYRKSLRPELPKQVGGNTAIEVAWTAFPAVVLAIVFALTLGTLRFLSSPQESSSTDPTQVLNITVVGHEWWWEFQYTDLGFTTANELHVPLGATVNFKIQSIDVIHSFWVPELGGKADAIPGHENFTWWKPTKVGEYWGHCTEYCGTQHALMNMKAFVDTPVDFQAWVANQQSPPRLEGLSGDEMNGQELVMTRGCQACHYIAGTKAVGRIGPDLTHFASRTTFAGAAFENHGVNVAKWVQDPQELKPKNKMPDLGLTQGEAQMVAGFLATLK